MRRADPLTIEEVQAVFGYLNRLDTPRSCMYAALAAVLVGLGPRISEVNVFRWSQLLAADGCILDRVTRRKLKTRKANTTITLKFNPVFVEYLVEWRNRQWKYGHVGLDGYVFCDGYKNTPINRDAARRFFKRVFRELGFDGSRCLTLHSFRKTFGTINLAYYRNKYDGDIMKAVRQVQKLYGHSTFETTMRYIGLDGDDPEESLDHVFGFMDKVKNNGRKISKCGQLDNCPPLGDTK